MAQQIDVFAFLIVRDKDFDNVNILLKKIKSMISH